MNEELFNKQLNIDVDESNKVTQELYTTVDTYDDEYDEGAFSFEQEQDESSLKEEFQGASFQYFLYRQLRKSNNILKSIFPDWIRTYKNDYFMNDFISGITVGALTVPQTLAYAVLVGLPPVIGLYTAAFPAIIFSLLTTSRHLSFGPDAVVCLLLRSVVHEVILKYASLRDLDTSEIYGNLELMSVYFSLCTMVVGGIIATFGILRLGFLASMLSRTIVDGLIVAVAQTIITSQLDTIFGIHKCNTILCPTTVCSRWVYDISNIIQGNYHIAPSIVFFCTLIVLFLQSKYHSHLPGGHYFPNILLVVFISLILSNNFNFERLGIETVGSKFKKITTSQLPWLQTLPSSIATIIQLSIRPSQSIACIIIIKSIAIAKDYANRHKYKIDTNKELCALGFTNFLSPFFGCITASVCLGRTRINEYAGAKTPMSSIFVALICLLTAFFLKTIFNPLPLATLSAIIIHTISSLLRSHISIISHLISLHAWDEQIVFSGMILIAITIDIETCQIFGFGISLLKQIKHTNRPLIDVLGFTNSLRNTIESLTNLDSTTIKSTWDSQYLHGITSIEKPYIHPQVQILRIYGSIHFANAGYLRENILRTIEIYPKLYHKLRKNSSSNNNINSYRYQPSTTTSTSTSTIHETNNIEKTNNLLKNTIYNDYYGIQSSQMLKTPYNIKKILSPKNKKNTQLRVLILDMSFIPSIDSSGIDTLNELVLFLRDNNIICCFIANSLFDWAYRVLHAYPYMQNIIREYQSISRPVSPISNNSTESHITYTPIPNSNNTYISTPVIKPKNILNFPQQDPLKALLQHFSLSGTLVNLFILSPVCSNILTPKQWVEKKNIQSYPYQSYHIPDSNKNQYSNSISTTYTITDDNVPFSYDQAVPFYGAYESIFPTISSALQSLILQNIITLNKPKLSRTRCNSFNVSSHRNGTLTPRSVTPLSTKQ